MTAIETEQDKWEKFQMDDFNQFRQDLKRDAATDCSTDQYLSASDRELIQAIRKRLNNTLITFNWDDYNDWGSKEKYDFLKYSTIKRLWELFAGKPKQWLDKNCTGMFAGTINEDTIFQGVLHWTELVEKSTAPQSFKNQLTSELYSLSVEDFFAHFDYCGFALDTDTRQSKGGMWSKIQTSSLFAV